MTNEQKMRVVLSKTNLSLNELSWLPTELLNLYLVACVSLKEVIETELMLLNGIESIALAKDDINTVKRNIKTIEGVIQLQTLDLAEVCMN